LNKQKKEMASPTFIPSGGNIVDIESTEWKTVTSLIYPGEQLQERGLKPKKVWVSAAAADSSVGMDLVLQEAATGRVLAGPSSTYSGSGVLQLSALVPLRASNFRTQGPPQILVLKARNRKAVRGVSKVGAMLLECSTSE
jgi:hypothetical protein